MFSVNRTIIGLVSGFLLLLFLYVHCINTANLHFHYSSIISRNNINTTLNDNYGIDVSFPVHNLASFQYNKNIKRQQEQYKEYMRGCIQKYNANICNTNEKNRLLHNSNQPKSLQNYTTIGYKKLKVPGDTYKLLHDYFKSHYNEHGVKEEWSDGNTYVNHWISPTYMLSIPKSMQNSIIYKLEPLIKQWISTKSKQEVKISSIYGIRIYKNNSILAPHVDRIPLISSVIINVEQDVDIPWPLEVYGHEANKARNITLVPGEMIFYESHSVIHGRPFPLVGRYYANLFIHYEPIGFNKSNSIVNNQNNQNQISSINSYRKRNNDMNVFLTVSYNDINTFQKIYEKSLLYQYDSNGWYILHEASRAGSYDIMHFLLQQYDDVGNIINVRTNFGYGGTALYWAIRRKNEINDEFIVRRYEMIINLLEQYGGIGIEPEEIQ